MLCSKCVTFNTFGPLFSKHTDVIPRDFAESRDLGFDFANWPDAQIPQYTSPISHKAQFCNRNVHMCAHFCYKMIQCGIFLWCIFWDLWDGSIALEHYNDVIMGAMAFQITSLTIVYSTVYSGADQRNRSSASLAFVRGIHRWPVNPRTKGQLRGNCFHLMTQ